MEGRHARSLGMTKQHPRAGRIALIAAAGHLIAYVLSIVLARNMSVEGFEHYVVAAAAFVLMIHFAPLGYDKYALRLLPALLERADRAGAAQFREFAVRRILRASLLIAAVVGAWTWQFRGGTSAMGIAIVASCLALAPAALGNLLAGALGAGGDMARATLILRVAVPSIALGAVGFVLLFPVPLTGALGIACWGVAWVAAYLWLRVETGRRLPQWTATTASRDDSVRWIEEARLFWAYGIAIAVMSQAGVVALELLRLPAEAIGAFGAAAGTIGALIAIVAATNGIYARRLSILLERLDVGAITRLRHERLRWLLPSVALFAVVVFTFPAEILALFRSEFVDDGVTSLRILIVSAPVTLAFALSPTYLMYRRRNRTLLAILATSVALQIALLTFLVPMFGAAGAAGAQAIAACVMFSAFTIAARIDLRQLAVRHGAA